MAVIRKYPFTFSKLLNLKSTVNPVYQNLKIKGIPDVLFYERSSLVTRDIAKRLNRLNYFDYIEKYYKDSYIETDSTPLLICFCDGSFTNLDYLNYDKEIVDYLNTKGLNIYLWELIVYRTPNTMSDSWLINANSESSIEEIFYNNKDSIVGFESIPEKIDNLKTFEFDKISNFVNRNKLTNVTVLTGNYDLEKYFKNQYTNLKFKTKDVVTASMFNISSNKLTSYSYIPGKTAPDKDKIEYKFCSWNKRYQVHRNLIAAYLLKEDSLISYNADFTDFLVNFKNFNMLDKRFNFWKKIENKAWFEYKLWETQHPEIYNKLKFNLEYLEKVRYLSVDRDIQDQWFNYEEDEIPWEYYYKSFCSVVTESEFAQPCGHYADKTLNSIKCFRPFVLVAPPHTLEYLKQSGVKTFSDYWDESYDEEENHEKRILKIFNVIDYINSLDLLQLKKMYCDMIPILNHNYRIIENLRF